MLREEKKQNPIKCSVKNRESRKTARQKNKHRTSSMNRNSNKYGKNMIQLYQSSL